MNSMISKRESLDCCAYPILGKYKSESKSFIVLFAAPRVGTVVYTEGQWPLGFYSETWEMHYFEIFTDKVILEN